MPMDQRREGLRENVDGVIVCAQVGETNERVVNLLQHEMNLLHAVLLWSDASVIIEVFSAKRAVGSRCG